MLHTFAGGDDGYGPGSGLTFDRHGNLFGMTPTGGADGLTTRSDGAQRLDESIDVVKVVVRCHADPQEPDGRR